jgi:hypothetical protein
MNQSDFFNYVGAVGALALGAVAIYVNVFLCLWPWLIYYRLKEIATIGRHQMVELEIIRKRLAPPQPH